MKKLIFVFALFACISDTSHNKFICPGTCSYIVNNTERH